MKKLIFVFLFTSFFVSSAFSYELSFKLGTSFAEPINYKATSKISSYNRSFHEDVDLFAPAITTDFYYWLHPNLHIGIGINAELLRNTDIIFEDISYYTPYISVKPNIDVKDFNLYALAKLGTTFLTYKSPYHAGIDIKQRVSYSFGLGAEYKNFILEFVYNNLHWGTDEKIGPDISYVDYTQHTYTFNIGYKINIFN